MNNLLIIIPAYNEGENLINLVKKIETINYNWNIIIIDDSDNLRTKKLINDYTNKKLHYVKRDIKMGRGNAVRYGFQYSIKNNFEYTLEMDADFSHDPDEINLLLKKIVESKSDLVIGSRYLKESKINGWPLKRLIFSKFSNFFAKCLFGSGITDYTNGFRIYNSNSINEIMKHKIVNNGFMYLTETFSILKKKNYKITEHSTIFTNRQRGISSVTLSEIINSFIGIIKLRFRKL